MQIIQTPHAPQPLGHYAQGIVHQGLVYVSGQLPLDPVTGQVVGQTIGEQVTQALANVAAILRAAGSGPEHVLQVTIYTSRIDLFAELNAAYARFFGEHRPARAAVPTGELPRGALVEIVAVAALPDTDG